MISDEQARAIANERAAAAYRDLSVYRVSTRLSDGAWYVDYDLVDPEVLGGGPHFAIDAVSGEVLSERFEQ